MKKNREGKGKQIQVIHFLEVFGSKYGERDPGRNGVDENHIPTIYLPTSFTKRRVFNDYVNALKSDFTDDWRTKQVQYNWFCEIWEEKVPKLKIKHSGNELSMSHNISEV